MSKKLTTKEFIRRSKKVHGNTYDYSKSTYNSICTKIEVVCKLHGSFLQYPASHFKGQGCLKCGILKRAESNKKRNDENYVVNKIHNIHGNKYNLDYFVYRGITYKSIFVCEEHGKFETTIRNIFKGHGCPKCGIKKSSKNKIIQEAEVINRIHKVHGNKYKLDKFIYTKMNDKSIFICEHHGEFKKSVYTLLKGGGCPKCGNLSKAKKLSCTTEIFIKRALKIHGNNKYDYSLVEYKNNNTEVKIICNKHGLFLQSPDKHINSKRGCPSCQESHGEREIALILNKLNISYKRQKRFDACRNKYPLPFDFYLLDYNSCIEYDGEYHFIKNSWNNPKDIQRRDKIKTKFCKDNGIDLLRIPYYDKSNIEQRVVSFIKLEA